MTYRALVTDTLAESGLEILRRAGDVELDYRPGLKGADLLKAVAESDALEPAYTFTGKELYVRARVTSTKPHPNPYQKGDTECAWTQPMVPQ